MARSSPARQSAPKLNDRHSRAAKTWEDVPAGWFAGRCRENLAGML
jgi:hypothetical protein